MDDIRTPAMGPNQTPKPKKKPEVPKTEISQSQDKSARNYIILMCVIIGLIVVAGGYIIYRLAMQFAYISNVNRAQDMLISALNTKQQNLDILKTKYDTIAQKGANGVSEANLILSAMPVSVAYDNLIATLEAMGQQSGVQVTSVTLSDSQSQSGEANSVSSQTTGIPVSFTVNVEGSYSAIIAFLQKTQQSARVINFNSMTITGSSGSSLTANITMTTYYQPEANIDSTYEPLK
jgi:Tfp pilus assembly protein PilO